MVKILGVKYFLHDSGIFYMDTKNMEIFGILTERVTRIKHDGGIIIPILKEYPNLRNIDYIAYPFKYTNLDFIIYKHLDEYVRKKYSPKYVKEYIEHKKEISQRINEFKQELIQIQSERKKIQQQLNNATSGAKFWKGEDTLSGRFAASSTSKAHLAAVSSSSKNLFNRIPGSKT